MRRRADERLAACFLVFSLALIRSIFLSLMPLSICSGVFWISSADRLFFTFLFLTGVTGAVGSGVPAGGGATMRETAPAPRETASAPSAMRLVTPEGKNQSVKVACCELDFGGCCSGSFGGCGAVADFFFAEVPFFLTGGTLGFFPFLAHST